MVGKHSQWKRHPIFLHVALELRACTAALRCALLHDTARPQQCNGATLRERPLMLHLLSRCLLRAPGPAPSFVHHPPRESRIATCSFLCSVSTPNRQPATPSSCRFQQHIKRYCHFTFVIHAFLALYRPSSSTSSPLSAPCENLCRKKQLPLALRRKFSISNILPFLHLIIIEQTNTSPTSHTITTFHQRNSTRRRPLSILKISAESSLSLASRARNALSTVIISASTPY